MIRRFNRYELKYVIHVFQMKALVQDLHHFVTPDSHGDSGGRYPIRSLHENIVKDEVGILAP